MMVYCRDRSQALPRRKGRYIKRKPPVSTNTTRCTGYVHTQCGQQRYRPDNVVVPSVMERRLAGGVWRSKDEDDADAILAELMGE